MQRPSANQVHMEMKDGLPRFRTHIKDGAVPVLDAALPGDLRGDQLTATNDLSITGARLL